jgi:hypothetical protein
VLSSRRCARVGESGDAMGCIRCRQKWPDVPLLLRTLVQSTYHARAGPGGRVGINDSVVKEQDN